MWVMLVNVVYVGLCGLCALEWSMNIHVVSTAIFPPAIAVSQVNVNVPKVT